MKIVTIAGSVGKDAILRRTQDGSPVLGFSVAVNDGYGENKSTMWFDVSIFGQRAEALEKHITKGSKITVSGELGLRVYEGKTTPTVRASEIALQGGNERQDSGKSGGDYGKASGKASGKSAAKPAQSRDIGQSMDFDSDEIPFSPEWR